MLTADEIRQKYLDYFAKKGHKIIPPAPLVLENDPTTLFTSSGMQPLVPYLLGQTHPEGKRLVDSQPSFRSQDIEEVGDNRHTTFFEMLGNWSLGDYFKKDQLRYFFEFLTNELNIDASKLYVTVFSGDPTTKVAKDTDSIEIWKALFKEKNIDATEVDLVTEENGYEMGMQSGRIFSYGVKKNWWSRSGTPDKMPVGEPGGPDSEVFYDFGLPHDNKYGKECHPNCDCGRFLEIGNSVFMQYQKQADGSLKELVQQNVDFGGGLERISAAVNHDPDVFTTTLFDQIINSLGIEYSSNNKNAMRVIADHIKASTFLIKDGVLPGNKGQGYFLRRLLRRAAVKTKQLQGKNLVNVVDAVFSTYPGYLASSNLILIKNVVSEELIKFDKTLEEGLKKIGEVSAFDLYQSYGFPLEIIEELYIQRGLQLDKAEFEKLKHAHQDQSRTASKGMFKGGLQDTSETTTKYHTATHLLHASLRKILGTHVSQKGSNITGERLRFDFSHPSKLSDEEIKKIEEMVNEKIAENIKVTHEEMDKQKALDEGALAFFPEKYPAVTNVYSIGDFSKELCGGPHVSSTGAIGRVKIIKEESVGSGVRRIYAELVS